ncbi:MAG: hypothetical protein CFK52_05420 [Chloracidobacterium sp. CP2_5A]|nr:MAG: hypothetical protein CFK52_05420 [Chloracidobacterium sp. CP2_5A]
MALARRGGVESPLRGAESPAAGFATRGDVRRVGKLKLEKAALAGRYLIQQRLAVGSRNEIFLARDESSGGLVVIKARGAEVFGQPLSAGGLSPVVARFRREGIWLDRLRHPHIVRRLDGGAARDLAGAAFDYHVLERLAGGDLATVSAASGGLPFAEAVRLLRQAVVALTHCHVLGVIHRDVEPGNLLLAADGQTLKLADFDAAASDEDASGGEDVFLDSDAADRPRVYLPPECQPGRLSPLSATIDVYALAKTLYAVLTGSPPADCIGQPIVALPSRLASLPAADALLEVLNQATAMRVTDRYPTVADFWSDVERVIAPPPGRALIGAELDGIASFKPEASANGSDDRPPVASPRPPAESGAPDHPSVADLPSPLMTRLIGIGIALACVALFIGGLTALYRFARELARELRTGRPAIAAPARPLFCVKTLAPTKALAAPTENPTPRDWVGDLSAGTEADVLEMRGNFYRARPQKWAKRRDASITEGWIPRESADGGW